MDWIVDLNVKEEPPRYRLVALALGVTARILVKFDYSAEQSAELMRQAWYVVQNRKVPK